MGPHRTSKGASSSIAGGLDAHSATKYHAKKRKQASTDDVPGVQKIKAALRQTKRLLAKENLAADVRMTTERRLKSLEGDLATAELARTERAMALRYHKVKFFERQKVIRKITQLKRMLDDGVNAEGEKHSKRRRKALETELLERRVDLNYILRYPKTSKYISLFPPGSTRNKEDEDSDMDDADAPHSDSGADDGAVETERKRQQLREAMREAMTSGQVSLQPENDLVGRAQSGKVRPVALAQPGDHGRAAKGKNHEPIPAQDLQDDAFFE